MFDFYLKNKIKSAFKNNKRTHLFHSFEDAKKILILFNYKDWNEVSIIEKELRNCRKTVLLWTHQTDADDISQTLPNTRDVKVIIPKEVSKIKGLNSLVIKEFEDLKYDTLIDLSTAPDDILLYLLSINKAEFCMGYKKYSDGVLDLCVLDKDQINILETYKLIKFYWDNIR